MCEVVISRMQWKFRYLQRFLRTRTRWKFRSLQQLLRTFFSPTFYNAESGRFLRGQFYWEHCKKSAASDAQMIFNEHHYLHCRAPRTHRYSMYSSNLSSGMWQRENGKKSIERYTGVNKLWGRICKQFYIVNMGNIAKHIVWPSFGGTWYQVVRNLRKRVCFTDTSTSNTSPGSLQCRMYGSQSYHAKQCVEVFVEVTVSYFSQTTRQSHNDLRQELVALQFVQSKAEMEPSL